MRASHNGRLKGPLTAAGRNFHATLLPMCFPIRFPGSGTPLNASLIRLLADLDPLPANSEGGTRMGRLPLSVDFKAQIHSPLGLDQPTAPMAASVRATSPSNNTETPTKAIGHGPVSSTSSSASVRLYDPGSLLINAVMAVPPA